jgi:hypothetical protein
VAGGSAPQKSTDMSLLQSKFDELLDEREEVAEILFEGAFFHLK